MGGGRGEGGARESISVLDRETKTGQCLNIEHMSLSPLKRANENRSHHCGPPYVRPSCRTERKRERFSLLACFAASCLLLRGLLRFHAVQPSVLFLLPSFLPLFFFLYFARLFSRRGEERERVTRECWFLSLSPSIHLSTFLFAINGSRFVKGIYCFER